MRGVNEQLTMGIIEAAETEAVGHAPAIAPAIDTAGTTLVQARRRGRWQCRGVRARCVDSDWRDGASDRPPTPVGADHRLHACADRARAAGALLGRRDLRAFLGGDHGRWSPSERAKAGDQVVILAGTPIDQAGTTNTVRVERIGAAR